MAKSYSSSSDSADAQLRPKNLAKSFSKSIAKLGGKASVLKAETTQPRGWDFGILIVLGVTMPGDPEFQATFSLNIARGDNNSPPEVSGITSVPSALGGTIATQRDKDPMIVAQRLISAFLEHFKPRKNEDVFEEMGRITRLLYR